MTAIDTAAWRAAYDDAQQEMERLIDAGTWVRGPSSLMCVIKAHRSELHQSRALAWLLDPYGSHRLGPRFLQRFLALVGADPTAFPPANTTVSTEVPTYDARERRAGSIDIVIASPSGQVVIENKWHAGETGNQLDRYWRARGPEGTFVFLTIDGDPPVRVEEPSASWKLLSWKYQIAPLVDELTADHPAGASVPTALLDYRTTLLEALR